MLIVNRLDLQGRKGAFTRAGEEYKISQMGPCWTLHHTLPVTKNTSTTSQAIPGERHDLE